MKISVVCSGKIKKGYLRDGIMDFSKRLSRYCTLEILESADEKTPEHASAAEEQAIKEKEGVRLLKNIPDAAYVIALEIGGSPLGSEEFAEKISSLTVSGISHIVFVIGGSLGLSDEVRRRSDFQLSFSKMTFPHQMMRLILLEQIYRGFRIMHHEPYHK